MLQKTDEVRPDHVRVQIFSAKLRSVQLFMLFCNLAVLNIIDILSGMFISLLFIANGYWFSNSALCRFNSAMGKVFFFFFFVYFSETAAAALGTKSNSAYKFFVGKDLLQFLDFPDGSQPELNTVT